MPPGRAQSVPPLRQRGKSPKGRAKGGGPGAGPQTPRFRNMSFAELLSKSMSTTQPPTQRHTAKTASEAHIEDLSQEVRALKANLDKVRHGNATTKYERDTFAQQLKAEQAAHLLVKKTQNRWQGQAESHLKAHRKLLADHAALKEQYKFEVGALRRALHAKDQVCEQALSHAVRCVNAGERNPLQRGARPTTAGSRPSAASSGSVAASALPPQPLPDEAILRAAREGVKKVTQAFDALCETLPDALQAQVEKQQVCEELRQKNEELDKAQQQHRKQATQIRKLTVKTQSAVAATERLEAQEHRAQLSISMSKDVMESAALERVQRERALQKAQAQLEDVVQRSEAQRVESQRALLAEGRRAQKVERELAQVSKEHQDLELEAGLLNDWRVKSAESFRHKYQWQHDEITKLRQTLVRYDQRDGSPTRKPSPRRLPQSHAVPSVLSQDTTRPSSRATSRPQSGLDQSFKQQMAREPTAGASAILHHDKGEAPREPPRQPARDVARDSRERPPSSHGSHASRQHSGSLRPGSSHSRQLRPPSGWHPPQCGVGAPQMPGSVAHSPPYEDVIASWCA